MHHCTRCGTPVDEGDGVVNEEEGYAYCGPCEADFQAAMAEEYPHGQCSHCGAKNFVYRYPDGREEIRAWHAEGQCPNWVDWNGLEDYDYDEPEAPEAKEERERSEAVDAKFPQPALPDADTWQAVLQAYCDKLRAAAGADAEPF